MAYVVLKPGRSTRSDSGGGSGPAASRKVAPLEHHQDYLDVLIGVVELRRQRLYVG